MNILILARMTSFFSGKTVYERPLGGSESALFYLSRELARLGHKIIIFNNCLHEAGQYEGVEYHQFTTLLALANHSKKTDYDLFISFRDLPAFLFPIKAKKRIWWGHDDFSNVWNYPDARRALGKVFLKFAGFLTNKFTDYIFVVSTWLGKICEDYLGIEKRKIYITKNGVYLPYFIPSPPSPLPSQRERGDLYRLVYTSVPDRGVDVLLDIFPEIRKRVPQATLHIYCGWDLGMLKEEDKRRAQILYDKTNIDGVFREGTKKHSDLAKDLLVSGLMLYPSHAVPKAGFYAETSCIAALEAQAAGCPVIASNRGALSESILQNKTGILIEGDPYSDSYKDKFIEETVSLLNDTNRYKQYSNNCVEFIRNNYSWEIIAREWIKKFEEILRRL